MCLQVRIVVEGIVENWASFVLVGVIKFLSRNLNDKLRL